MKSLQEGEVAGRINLWASQGHLCGEERLSSPGGRRLHREE
jgi:hypothetical protein